MEITIEQLKQIVATLENRVSFEQIASMKNIEISYATLGGNPKGFALPMDNQWYICLKQGLTGHEREMTLGHELAHAWLGIRNDTLAESFAAEMLFHKRLSEFLESVKALSDVHSRPEVARVLQSFINLYCLQGDLVNEQRKGLVNLLALGVGFVSLISLVIMGIGKLRENYNAKKERTWMPSPLAVGYTRGFQAETS